MDQLTKDQIIAEYLDYLETVQQAPGWVYKFADATAVNKDDFYLYFEDITDLETQIWSQQIESTMEVLSNDPGYPNYTAREKLLAFYFTLLEIINDQSQALGLILNRSLIPGIAPAALTDFKQSFSNFTQELIQTGLGTNEIENRPLVTSYYGRALWFQCLFLLRFWKNDKSPQRSATDEAVERSVNLLFDLAGHTPVDSAVGFTRFVYRNKKLLL
jgi:AcrR family transcriptional regulator